MAELKDKDEQYSIFLKYKENNDEGKTIFTLRVIFIMFFFCALTSLVMFIVSNFDDLITVFSPVKNSNSVEKVATKTTKQNLAPAKFNFKMLSRYQNILLLGVDSNGPNTLPYSGVRSDTIVILSADLQGKSINAISIPRDSKVYLADEHGVQKINSAYAIGGIELTKKTIEETLGIRIHNYVIVNAEGIRKLIDAIGGVPIHIDQNMFYHDYSANLHISFTKGDYVLNGQQSENYLRYRKDHLGDIGRVHRQQKFIKSLIEQIKSPEAIKKIPEALKIASLYTRTDLNLYQMSQYAAMAREIDMNKVEFVMLPGAPNKKGIISYWILDPEKTQQTINRLIYRKKTELSADEISVGVMFAKDMEIEAIKIKDELKNQGYSVNCLGRSSKIEKSQILGYNSQISSDVIKSMKKKVPTIQELDFIHAPVRNFCTTSDVVVTIKGNDTLEF